MLKLFKGRFLSIGARLVLPPSWGLVKRLIYGSASLALISLMVLFSSGGIVNAIDPGLELHWNLDEGSGTVATDDSGHGNGGTLYNGATYVPGHDNLAVELDGISQYVQVDNPLTSLGTTNQPYALSAWVKIAAGVTQGNIIHISSNADGSGWCIPFLRAQSGVFAATGWDSTVGQVDAIGTTPFQTGQWYQVLTSWDATNGLRLFVDGALAASTPQADYSAAGAPIYISAGLSNVGCSDDQGFLKGDVDDVRIYSRALTSTDIQSIATEGNPIAPTIPTTPVAVANSVASPDTGYGLPPKHRPLVLAASVGSALALGAGFALLYRRRAIS